MQLSSLKSWELLDGRIELIQNSRGKGIKIRETAEEGRINGLAICHQRWGSG